MIDYVLLLLFVVFVILIIMDFITTEYVLKLGGYEKSLLLKYSTGQPVKRAIVKSVIIVVVSLIVVYVTPFLGIFVVAQVLLVLDLCYGYAQVNNVKLVLSVHR
jgi:hypothetical protein